MISNTWDPHDWNSKNQTYSSIRHNNSLTNCRKSGLLYHNASQCCKSGLSYSSPFDCRWLLWCEMQVIRGMATRYTYNKTIPQTIYSPENVVFTYSSGRNPEIPNPPRTKLGLASGKALPSCDFVFRHIHYDEDKNILEDYQTPFDKPFYDLIRDDLWVCDPLSLTVLAQS